MNKYITYKCILIILILVEYSNCGDKQNDEPYNNIEDEDNFEVTTSTDGLTEPAQPPIHTQTQEEPTSHQPQQFYQPPPQKPPNYLPQQQPLYQPYPGYQIPYLPYGPYQPQPSPIQPQPYPQPQQPHYPPPHPIPVIQYYPIPQPQQPYQPHYQPYQQGYQPYQPTQPPAQPQYYPHPGYQPYQPYIPQPPQPVPGYYLPYQPYQPQPVLYPPQPQPPEIIMTTKTMKFMKMNEEGILVEMGPGDYYKSYENKYSMKFEFSSNLEQLLFDGEIIYNHKPENKYCTSLIYYKSKNVFIMTRDKGFLITKFYKGKWVSSTRRIPDYIEIHGKDSEDRDVLITDEQYRVSLSTSGYIKYIFNENVKCTKIIIHKKLSWKKESNEEYPIGFSITSGRNLTVYFNDYLKVFGSGGPKTQYKQLSSLKKYDKSED
ncbi:Theileria-specific sub-telomeric protein, SVSP family, putative [Theileria annulata]|uniref:Theileria-specific sub-telomeric protein, SVSP family, putative n=1 Tax=Theileria annulata TaxID=5874 RepID=Q4UAT0_THEAN|nr:Theileria-specific sub-telomeric protein, SVSP family, putative [Theileria annulata]CAI76071.1 Theileria-specific sub-telomeric protein, SVSP family, putative [Theileria annulata]|eukprot:XP_955547.1 Theileria-specific sub-telomeric protein, SVSP family, putative [Theileria annulata]